MLPHKRNDAHEEGDRLRTGFEVHVIGAKRSAPEPSDGKGLEIGLQIGTGQAHGMPGDAAGTQVPRLEAEDAKEPPRARTISEVVNEVGPAGPYVPRGQRKKRSVAAWTVWMGAGTCTLAIAAVAGAPLFNRAR